MSFFSLGYGPERYKDMEGLSLPSVWKRIRQTRLEQPDQRPVVKFALPDKPRLRAKECVQRYMRLVKGGRR